MPTGIYIRTEEHKKAISNTMKGMEQHKQMPENIKGWGHNLLKRRDVL